MMVYYWYPKVYPLFGMKYCKMAAKNGLLEWFVGGSPGTASMSQLPGLERLLQALAAGGRLPRTGHDPGRNRVFSRNIGMRTELPSGNLT